MRDLAILRALNTALAFTYEAIHLAPAPAAAPEELLCPRCQVTPVDKQGELCLDCWHEAGWEAEDRGQTDDGR